MVCSPRTVDGRCHPTKVVYEMKGERVETPVGRSIDARISWAHIQSTFKTRPGKQGGFPDQIHLVMTPTLIRVSDIKGSAEKTRIEFSLDPDGLKMKKAYDDLQMWMGLYRGLNHEPPEIHLNQFYENLVIDEYFA